MPWRSIAATQLGDANCCAQVHPAKLCKALFAAADGVDLVVAAAVGIIMEEDQVSGAEAEQVEGAAPFFPLSPASRRVRALQLESGDELQVGSLVLALGPWSDRAADWLPAANLPRIFGHQED